MKFKAFLLTSSAALMASTAYAADPVAEPEPVNSVRVCDMYGAGYSYIPGTETCIKISGLVRSTYTYDTGVTVEGTETTNEYMFVSNVEVTDDNGTTYIDYGDAPTGDVVNALGYTHDLYNSDTDEYVFQKPDDLDDDATDSEIETYDADLAVYEDALNGGLAYNVGTDATEDEVTSVGAWTYRARMNIETANESDWGVVKSYIRLQGDGSGGGNADATIDRALLSIGGLRIGYTDVYWSTNHGYGTPGPINDTPSGYDQAVIADYTFSANGLGITVGIQDEDGGEDGAENLDVYAGINYAGSWGTFAATIGHDTLNATSAGRVSLSLTVIDGVEVKGLYAAKFDEDEDNHFLEENWEYGVGINWQATDPLNIYVAYYDADADESSAFVFGGNWEFAAGMRTQAEVTMREDEEQEFRFRVQRSF